MSGRNGALQAILRDRLQIVQGYKAGFGQAATPMS